MGGNPGNRWSSHPSYRWRSSPARSTISPSRCRAGSPGYAASARSRSPTRRGLTATVPGCWSPKCVPRPDGDPHLRQDSQLRVSRRVTPGDQAEGLPPGDPPFWQGSHNLRNCGCGYCTQDRRTFRDALDPLLTREESDILDICDRLEPRITDALYDASADMMEALAGKLGMTGEQVLALKEHIRGCPNSTSELTMKSRTIESDFAYLLFALGQFQEREEMLDDQGFQQVMMRWDTVMVKEEDEEDVFRTVLPAADEIAEKVALAGRWKPTG